MPRPIKRWVLGAGTIAVAFGLMAGCGGKDGSVTSAASNPSGTAVLTVATVEAVSRPIAAAVQVTGTYIAKESSDVAPEAAGRVVETPVNAGDFVKEGQVIARLEQRDAQLRLDQAKASEQQAEAALRQAETRIGLAAGQDFNPEKVPEVLAAKASHESALAQAKLAEADAQRNESLLESKILARSEYDRSRAQADASAAQANAALKQYEVAVNQARQNYHGIVTAQASLAGARAQTAIAQKAVEDTLIRAPFSGYVSARPVAVGQYVALTSKIATVLRITPIKLELQVPEFNLPQVRLAAEVEAKVPGYPDRVFQGKVTAVNPAVDPNSRAVSVEAEFPNTGLALKPGMFATARILLQGTTDGIFVPSRAILTDATTNSSQVFFVRDGKARVAVVQPGMKEGDLTQIVSGLGRQAVVITDHLQDLYDGQSVQTLGAGTLPASKRGS